MLTLDNTDLARFEHGMDRFSVETGIEFTRVLLVQAALLAKEMVAASPPKNLAQAKAKAVNFSKNFFAKIPNKTPLLRGNRVARKRLRQGEDNETLWLYAGPRYLVGTKKENYDPNYTVKDMISHSSRERGRKKFGTRYHDAGRLKLDRTKNKTSGLFQRFTKRKVKDAVGVSYESPQHAIIINRKLVRGGPLRGFERYVKDSFGKLKAAWASNWDKLRVNGTIPGWIARHIPSMRRKGNRVDLDLKSSKPSITIRIVASGAEGNDHVKIARAALKSRFHKMKADLKYYLDGTKLTRDFGRGTFK